MWHFQLGIKALLTTWLINQIILPLIICNALTTIVHVHVHVHCWHRCRVDWKQLSDGLWKDTVYIISYCACIDSGREYEKKDKTINRTNSNLKTVYSECSVLSWGAWKGWVHAEHVLGPAAPLCHNCTVFFYYWVSVLQPILFVVMKIPTSMSYCWSSLTASMLCLTP